MLAPALVGCLFPYPMARRGPEEERRRLAAALEREAADPTPRTGVEKLLRRHLLLADLSRSLAGAAGLDGGRERDPVPPATRLARAPKEPPPA